MTFAANERMSLRGGGGAARLPPLRVGVLVGRLAPGGVLGGGRVSEPGVRPQGGADARGDLVQPPVELPVVAEVVLAVKPLPRPQRERRSELIAIGVGRSEAFACWWSARLPNRSVR
jgi:hypothetical protein